MMPIKGPKIDPRTGITSTQCVQCGKALDAATHPLEDDIRPSPGDFTICFGCGFPMAFTEKLGLRPLTDAEMLDAATDPEFRRLQKFIVDHIK